MGTVYLGRGHNGQRVAVKTIRTEYAWDDTLRGRFRTVRSARTRCPV